MATYTLSIYDYNPSGIFPTTVGNTFSYAGPATADGTAVVTDNQAGIDGETLSALAQGETATADVTVGGNTSTGSNVDAEDAWTLRDTVTGKVFQVTSMEVRSGAAAGHYLIAEYPLVVGRTYEVVEYNNLPSTSSGPIFNYTQVVCFTPGALILTPLGEVPVEHLKVGDLVTTMDNGPQPIRWIGRRDLTPPELERAPHLKPVLIRAGAMGNRQDLLVSPQHRMLVRPPRKWDCGGGGEEQLIRAKHLAEYGNGRWRIARGCRRVRYLHLLFDAHQIIFAAGAPTESLFPGPMALRSLDRAALREVTELFPGIVDQAVAATARRVAGRGKARDWAKQGVFHTA